MGAFLRLSLTIYAQNDRLILFKQMINSTRFVTCQEGKCVLKNPQNTSEIQDVLKEIVPMRGQ
jgi:hypothetical protein